MDLSQFQSLVKIIPFAGLIAVFQWYLGYRVSLRTAEFKSLDLLDKLSYTSQDAKNDFIRSSVFTHLTKRAACIHHINLMLNTYDPRRLLGIYRKAPGFVAFGAYDVEMPNSLKTTRGKAAIFMFLLIMVLSPLWFLLLDYGLPTTNIKHYRFFGFMMMLPLSIYGIYQCLFIREVFQYYDDKAAYWDATRYRGL